MRSMSLALMATMLFACGKKDAPVTTAPVKTSAPGRAPVQKAKIYSPKKNAVHPGSQPTSRPTSQPASMPAYRSTQPGGALPAGHPPTGGAKTQAAAPSGPAGNLSGKITLAPDQAANIKPGSVLFIIVRRDAGEGQRGMLLAAKKIPVTGAKMFPYSYMVTPKDVMMAGTVLNGSVRVEARVDQDGDAISKQPGDIVGGAKGAHQVGSDGVDFSLLKSL